MVWNTIRILLVLGGIAFVGLSLSGWFDPYWERYPSVWDPQLQQFRCMSQRTGALADVDPPCVGLTLAGRYVLERRAQRCLDEGGTRDKCRKEAWDWMDTKKPQ
jgi:uncharacterized iron-regulated membrane protein